MKPDFKLLEERIHAHAVRNGFWENPNKGEKIALMHSELSEGLEGVRKPQPDSHCPEFSSETIEMADTVIRIIDYCKFYNLPLADAMVAKVIFNESRPFKHGKAF